MTLTQLKDELIEIPDCGVCYGYFPENQEPPYISYQATSDNSVVADGLVLYSESNITMMVVTQKRCIDLENIVDCILRKYRVIFQKSYETDGEQHIHITTYQFAAENC